MPSCIANNYGTHFSALDLPPTPSFFSRNPAFSPANKFQSDLRKAKKKKSFQQNGDHAPNLCWASERVAAVSLAEGGVGNSRYANEAPVTTWRRASHDGNYSQRHGPRPSSSIRSVQPLFYSKFTMGLAEDVL